MLWVLEGVRKSGHDRLGENDWFSTFALCVGMLCLICGGVALGI